jgi:hypothetical protein
MPETRGRHLLTITVPGDAEPKAGRLPTRMTGVIRACEEGRTRAGRRAGEARDRLVAQVSDRLCRLRSSLEQAGIRAAIRAEAEAEAWGVAWLSLTHAEPAGRDARARMADLDDLAAGVLGRVLIDLQWEAAAHGVHATIREAERAGKVDAWMKVRGEARAALCDPDGLLDDVFVPVVLRARGIKSIPNAYLDRDGSLQAVNPSDDRVRVFPTRLEADAWLRDEAPRLAPAILAGDGFEVEPAPVPDGFAVAVLAPDGDTTTPAGWIDRGNMRPDLPTRAPEYAAYFGDRLAADSFCQDAPAPTPAWLAVVPHPHARVPGRFRLV